ncbi:metal ABC transporter substrate-binding protein [Cellulosimicrobium marinum]|uniref:metal ABC transporter substrate-binding protein n=1 Tax=Cellulosimicrobium marinum TaxID=1638992 RepID=UPI001E3E01CA|nr:metal ABC transporter substrate-binding protein [Cellulosimicrobium marinum]MCB7135967.1 metal ABC transporter substrate-binding protein [Cellulosimicrobium marinum]
MPNFSLRAPLTSGAALATTLALAACSAGTESGSAAAGSDDRPVVLTTFTVLADMAENVAGDHLRVESITKVGAEIHGYEPTPGDLRRAADADLVLDNGLGLEAWFDRFLGDVDAPHVVVSEGVETIPLGDDTAEEYRGTANPHAWMSPVNGQLYARTMAEAFADLDPEHADDYRTAAEEYAAEIGAVHDELTAALDTLPAEHRALVTCEGAFSYLARDVGLTEHYLWPVNAEQQATPQQVAGTIEAVEADDVPAVFCESTVSDAPMQRVVEATGARFGGVLYVDSLSEPDGPVPTYLDLLRHDADTIVAGLTGTPAGGGE